MMQQEQERTMKELFLQKNNYSSILAVASMVLLIVSPTSNSGVVEAFQQTPFHHHPVYVRYRLEHLEHHSSSSSSSKQQQHQQQEQHDNSNEALETSVSTRTNYPHLQVDLQFTPSTPIAYDDETGMAMVPAVRDHPDEEQTPAVLTHNNDNNQILSTPISYDKNTGMVQTAVRAIVQHPLLKQSVVNNAALSVSSTLVISLGAMHEFVDCLELEWAHHATSSTEGLALLSLGHFFHYGRETVKQLVEYHESTSTSSSTMENDNTNKDEPWERAT